MTDDLRPARPSKPGGAGSTEEIWREDLRALRQVSARDLPRLEQTGRLLRESAAKDIPGGILMSSIRRLRTRPWTVSAVAAAALAAVLLLLPISYQKTIGHDVALTLSAPTLAVERLQSIAGQFKTVLAANGLTVTRQDDGSAVVTARVSGSSDLPVAPVAEAFARELAGEGITASVRVTPHTERVLGSLYAYARDNILEIHVENKGKTPQQIQDEIVARLRAAGYQDPKVEYKQEGNKTTLEVQTTRSSTSAGTAADLPQLKISVGDHPPNDAQEKRVTVNVQRTPGMTDAQVIEEAKKQLQAQGVDGDVTIENGHIRIQARTK